MDKFFTYVNSIPMPVWLAMMFAPRHHLTERLSRSSTVFGISALHYVISLIIAMRQGQEEGTKIDFMSLEGVRNMMGTRQGATAAWTHMIALDLFTGAWIYRQCRRLSAPAWVRIPSLFFTLMSGPFGLLLFLIWRTFGANKGEALPNVDMSSDTTEQTQL
ncbi:MAG: ABA4-like family protein [Chloroflexota bacterium]